MRVVGRHVRLRLALMAVLLLVGALLFRALEPEKGHTLSQAAYFTFALIFGETPEEFPRSRVLQVLFFLMPILGLTVIIEGIVDFALVLRDRRRFERTWCIMLAASFRDHVVIVGLGRLGSRTYQTLRRLGYAVVVIERDPENRFLEDVRRDGSPLLVGDGRQEALLAEANVAAARSVVIATDDDLANLEIALDARCVNPKVRVVLRMFDQNMADKIADGFDIRLSMSTTALSAPTFASCAIAPATVNSFIVGDQLIVMQRWLVRGGGLLCGRTVAQVMREHGITIVEHRHPGDSATICPAPETRLEAGDGLLIQGPIEVLEALRESALAETV